ncbi:MAG: hypothetical protein EZS28_015868 [Streblomastix strix]|uniref:Uncharacterized protein n=1 Tax=Streblomastix strix TaxID=222440 RepID=A0A5J4W1C7_9EUKA|nr:MAG: hypothetical protein EZS28_015868 [Streblomastix strix]
MFNTQGEGKELQGDTNFKGGITERISDHVLLNSKGLQDGTNLEEAQLERSQTELSSHETRNLNYVPSSAQGEYAFTYSMYDISSQQHDMIRDQNLIIAGNTFLSQQTVENVDSPSTLPQGSLAGTGGTLGNGLEQCSESLPHNGASAQLSAEYYSNKRLNALIHGSGRKDGMIRANMGLDQVMGVHNDRCN